MCGLEELYKWRMRWEVLLLFCTFVNSSLINVVRNSFMSYIFVALASYTCWNILDIIGRVWYISGKVPIHSKPRCDSLTLHYLQRSNVLPQKSMKPVAPLCNQPAILSNVPLHTKNIPYDIVTYLLIILTLTRTCCKCLAVAHYDHDRYNDKYQEMMTREGSEMQEGCFCMEGTILFNTYSDVCVTSCGNTPFPLL